MGVCVPQRQILISAPSKGFECLNHVRSGRLYQRKKNARQRNNAACGKMSVFAWLFTDLMNS